MPKVNEPSRPRPLPAPADYPRRGKLPTLPPVRPGEPFPLFSRLAVETCAACNRSCGFCPVSDGRRKGRGINPMSRPLFSSICDQLRELRWDGFVELYILNEPLLDPYLEERAHLLRSACPKSTIFISTNGDLLDRRRDRDAVLERLYASGINSINLNIYDEGPDQAARYRGYYEHWQRSGLVLPNHHKYNPVPTRNRYMSLTDMRVSTGGDHSLDPFYDRKFGDRDRGRTPSFLCPHPSRTLTIRYDGKVMPCCVADPTHPATEPLGDVETHSLLEVWNNDNLFRYRYFLGRRGGREVLATCQGCTYKNHRPAQMRRVDADAATVARWQAESAAEVGRTRALIQLGTLGGRDAQDK